MYICTGKIKQGEKRKERINNKQKRGRKISRKNERKMIRISIHL